jgi:rod shape-determining protein MreC
MSAESDRSLSRGDNARFFLCLTLSFALLLGPRHWGEITGNVIRRSVLVPFLYLQERAEDARTSRAVRERLTSERDSAAYAAQLLPAVRLENQRLRGLIGLTQRLSTHYVAAEVLHQSLPTDGRTLLLNRGRDAGVKAFDAVVAPEGLIGVIRSVSDDRSVAMTWAHPEFRASAFAANGAVFGVVAPAPQADGGDMLLQLRGVAYRDTISVGSEVLTSGLGGVYPQGIPVGTVIGLIREEAGWQRAYLLRPAANPAIASHVLIITTPHDNSVESAFKGDSTP